MSIFYQYVVSELELVQSPQVKPSYLSIRDELTFTQDIHNSTPHLFVSNIFQDVPLDEIIDAGTDDLDALAELYSHYGLKQSVDVHKSIIAQSITHNLNLSQNTASNTIIISIESHINWQSFACQAQLQLLNDNLYLSQIVVATRCRGATNIIALTQSAEYIHIVTRLPDSTLAILSKATYYKEVKSPLPTPLVHRDTTLLSCSDSRLFKPLSIELRNPDFNNAEQLEYRRINRRARGGTLQLYRDSNWPKSRRLVYTFSQLDESKKKELLKFLEDTIGYEVNLTDFESREWLGIITTPAADAQQGDPVDNSITLQFDGVVQ